MLIKVNSVAPFGVNTLSIIVEVNVASRGFPTFDIVGLPSKAVAESRERVKTAILNSGFDFPSKKITINLAPADINKEGSFYDLPIAVGILSAFEDFALPKGSIFYGELSLDGKTRHTRGCILASIHGKQFGFEEIYIPIDNSNEASAVEGLNVYGVLDLLSLVSHFKSKKARILPSKHKHAESMPNFFWDFGEVKGQNTAKRALQIAAAGGHNVLLIGPPGVGKSMLAKCVPSILPDLDLKESLEVTKIYSSAGLIPPNGSLLRSRPFRSPHHTVSYAGIVGGGSIPRPGEISLAHRGVLFLDEFPEFPRYILESLRQPMEEGTVTISRSHGNVTFPSKFMLLAASNPCPCGYYGHPSRGCTCSDFVIQRYQKRISGPILDRIDLVVNLLPVDIEKISLYQQKNSCQSDLTSFQLREGVAVAKRAQNERFVNENILTNKEMTHSQLKKYCSPETRAQDVLDLAAKKYNFSPRSYFKVLKVSRTIADIAGVGEIKQEHVLEALEFIKSCF